MDFCNSRFFVMKLLYCLMKHSGIYFIMLLILITTFSIYNFFIYTSKTNYGSVRLSQKAINGENIWLKNNCNACHQIYGLGGYLGPDLTNIASTKGKNKTYIKSLLNSGIRAMPKFNFTETEKEALCQFLEEIDKTGHYPDMNAAIKKNGWVSINYKHENYEK